MANDNKSEPIVYLWCGVNRQGEKVKGEMSAPQVAIVKAQLRQQGITPEKVKRKSNGLFSPAKKTIKSAEIAALSRQLATMIDAGIPLAQSVKIISTGHENASVKALMDSVHADIESGLNLSDALSKHPKYFNELYCNLVNAGEQSGSLDIMLNKIAHYREKAEAVKSKIKKALFYPVAVIIFSFLIAAGLLIFIVPKFAEMFKSFGADLPLPTQIVLDLSAFFQDNWWLMILMIILSVYFLMLSIKKFPKFARFVDGGLLKLPIFGVILKRAAIARFTRTLSTTFAAGLPLIDSLDAVAGATGNILYKEATLKIKEEVATGQSMQQVMRQFDLFPNMVVQMIAIGEESGSLEKMLAKIADSYEQLVEDAVDGLSSLIEPVIMVVIGGMIGCIVIAMYLPIFQMGSIV